MNVCSGTRRLQILFVKYYLKTFCWPVSIALFCLDMNALN